MTDKIKDSTADKSVMEQVFDKFDEFVKDDDSFTGIADDLAGVVRNEKRKKSEIETVLKKVVERKK